MEAQVEKFDPSKLMDGVKDRIKATFVSLIPDDQWETMCKVEMDKFFQASAGDKWGNGVKVSEFESIVKDLMQEHCKNYLKELLAKPEYSITTVWENNPVTNMGANKTKLSEHLDAMIKEKMPDMMQAMFTSVMNDALYAFFNQIQQKLQGNRY